MDHFCEQLIARKKKPGDIVLKLVLIFTSVLAVALLVISSFLMVFGAFSALLLPVAFGIAVLSWYMATSMNIEYEYTLTNDYFDIDKILGKRKRKRILSTQCSKFEEFGEYNEETAKRLLNRSFDQRLSPCNTDGSVPLYYAVLSHPSRGRVLLVIQPNESMLQGLKAQMPRPVARDAFGRHGSY